MFASLAIAAMVLSGVLALPTAARADVFEPVGTVSHYPLTSASTYTDVVGANSLSAGSSVAFRATHVSLVNPGNANNGHIAGSTPASSKVVGDVVSFSFENKLNATQTRTVGADRAIFIYGGKSDYLRDSISVRPYWNSSASRAAVVVRQAGVDAIVAEFDAPTPDLWHHYAVSLDGAAGGRLTVDVDGARVVDVAANGIGADEIGNETLRLNRWGSSVASNLDTHYRDVRIVAATLTDDEVSKLAGENAAFAATDAFALLPADGAPLSTNIVLPAGVTYTVPEGQTALRADGTVTVPSEGSAVDVQLIASYRGVSITRSYQVIRVAAQAPTITPAAGVYYGPQQVQIAAGDGAAVFYTLDGSDPTAETGTRYTGPFAVGVERPQSSTVRAISVVDRQSPSAVASAEITVLEWAAAATPFRLEGESAASNVKIGWESRGDADSYRVYRGAGAGKTLITQTTGDVVDDYDLSVGSGYTYTVEAYRGGTLIDTATTNPVKAFEPTGITRTIDNITGQSRAIGEPPAAAPRGQKIGDRYYQYTFGTNGGEGASRTLEIRESVSTDGLAFSAPATIYSVADRKVEGGGFVFNPETRKFTAFGHLERTTPGAGYTFASYLLAEVTPGTGAAGTGSVEVWTDPNASDTDRQRPFGLDTRDQSLFVDDDGRAYVLAAVHNNADIAIIALNDDWTAPAEHSLVFRGQHRETPSISKVDGEYYFFSSRASGWYPSQTAYASSADILSGWSPLRTIGNAAGFDAQFNHVAFADARERSTYATVSWHWGGQRVPASPLGTITRTVPLTFHDGFAVSEWFARVDIDADYGHVPVQAGRLVSLGAAVTDPLATAGSDLQRITDGADSGVEYVSHTAAGYQITLDLGAVFDVAELSLATRLVGGSETMYKYTFERSIDGSSYTEIVDGRENVFTGFIPVRLDEPAAARYIRFTALDWPKVNGPRAFDGIYEIAAYGARSDVEPDPATPVSQAEAVLVATVTGSAPDLPETVLFATVDDGEQQVPVAWDLTGYTFGAAYQTYTVSGRTSNGVAATASVHAVPASTLYFVDSASAASGSPVFDAVKAALGDQVLQNASDQSHAAGRTWGFVPQAGDGPVVRPDGSGSLVTTDLYQRILASRTPTLDYRIQIPAAGTYTITARTTELWANQNRNMQFRFTDPSGTVTNVGNSFVTNSSGQRVQVTGKVQASGPGLATFSVARSAGSANPQIAWFSVAAGEITVAPLTVAAPRAIPGGSTLTGPTDVELVSLAAGAAIYYTVDGSTPTRATGTLYTEPIRVSAAGTVKAIAWLDGVTSPVSEQAYSFVDRPDPYTSVPVGQPWFDTDGELIQAHGGGFLEHDGWYWWVGENKSHHGASFYAVSLYRSKDLLNWEFRGNILTPESATGPDAPRLAFGQVKVERPKLLFNEATGKFVLWGHWETADSYAASRLVVATSDTIDGLYTYEDDFRPGEGEAWTHAQRAAIQASVDNGSHATFAAAEVAYAAAGNVRAGYESRDFTVYKDPDSSAAYLISAESHHNLRIYPLTADYTQADWENSYPLFAGESREATAVIKADGVFYLLSSGQSGWYANQLKYAYTTDLASPDGWSQNINIGNNTTFKSQPTYVMDIPKAGGGHSYVYMGDRWTPTGGLGNSTYVWLPLEIGADPASDVNLQFTDGWSLDVNTGDIVRPRTKLVSERKPSSSSAGQASAGYTNPAAVGFIDDPAVVANPAAAANDGVDYSAGRFDNTHYWQPTGALPFRWQVDLEEDVDLSRLDVSWRSYNGSETYSTYRVYGSADGSDWSLLADRTGSRVVGFTSDALTGTYRHVRIEVTSVINDHNNSGASWAAGIVEAQVYGTPVDEIPTAVSVTGGGDLTVGGTRSLAATVAPSTADQAVRWTSSDPAVITVSADGVVTGVAPGTAIITATSLRHPAPSGQQAVTVTSPIPAAPLWQSAAVYTAGDSVTLGGRTYVAQWWTQNQTPGGANGPWAEVGAAVACDIGGVRAWTPTWVYTGGETIADGGRVWRAKWWTRNQTPGDQWGPWEDIGACRAG